MSALDVKSTIFSDDHGGWLQKVFKKSYEAVFKIKGICLHTKALLLCGGENTGRPRLQAPFLASPIKKGAWTLSFILIQ